MNICEGDEYKVNRKANNESFDWFMALKGCLEKQTWFDPLKNFSTEHTELFLGMGAVLVSATTIFAAIFAYCVDFLVYAYNIGFYHFGRNVPTSFLESPTIEIKWEYLLWGIVMVLCIITLRKSVREGFRKARLTRVFLAHILLCGLISVLFFMPLYTVITRDNIQGIILLVCFFLVYALALYFPLVCDILLQVNDEEKLMHLKAKQSKKQIKLKKYFSKHNESSKTSNKLTNKIKILQNKILLHELIIKSDRLQSRLDKMDSGLDTEKGTINKRKERQNLRERLSEADEEIDKIRPKWTSVFRRRMLVEERTIQKLQKKLSNIEEKCCELEGAEPQRQVDVLFYLTDMFKKKTINGFVLMLVYLLVLVFVFSSGLNNASVTENVEIVMIPAYVQNETSERVDDIAWVILFENEEGILVSPCHLQGDNLVVYNSIQRFVQADNVTRYTGLKKIIMKSIELSDEVMQKRVDELLNTLKLLE